jgi:predicted dehydrogenase
METVRWGIIGCGDVTEVKSGPALQKADGSELIAVMRRDAAKAADYARRHGVPKSYADADALINDPDINAVYIATPPAWHEPYALKVCAAGKACYVEKPMARNTAEARRMTEAFARAKIPLFVAYYRRALPKFVKAKQIIAGGEIGPLRSASYSYHDSRMNDRTDPVPWRFNPEIAGGGLFLDLGSHALDVLDFLLGPLNFTTGSASNAGKKYPTEDRVEVTFTAMGCVQGRADFQFASDRKEDSLLIEGKIGQLQLSCFAGDSLRLQDRPIELPSPPHVQQPLVQAIVDSLRGVSPAADWLPTAEVALRTQTAMDFALKDYYGGREDGFWKRRRPM